jgi:hypothetical protein
MNGKIALKFIHKLTEEQILIKEYFLYNHICMKLLVFHVFYKFAK